MHYVPATCRNDYLQGRRKIKTAQAGFSNQMERTTTSSPEADRTYVPKVSTTAKEYFDFGLIHEARIEPSVPFAVTFVYA